MPQRSMSSSSARAASDRLKKDPAGTMPGGGVERIGIRYRVSTQAQRDAGAWPLLASYHATRRAGNGRVGIRRRFLARRTFRTGWMERCATSLNAALRRWTSR